MLVSVGINNKIVKEEKVKRQRLERVFIAFVRISSHTQKQLRQLLNKKIFRVTAPDIFNNRTKELKYHKTKISKKIFNKILEKNLDPMKQELNFLWP